MNVALWAEIRRLAEVEKLTGRAILRRLHCSRHSVAAALELDQPPARQAPRCTKARCWPSICAATSGGS